MAVALHQDLLVGGDGFLLELGSHVLARHDLANRHLGFPARVFEVLAAVDVAAGELAQVEADHGLLDLHLIRIVANVLHQERNFFINVSEVLVNAEVDAVVLPELLSVDGGPRIVVL